MDVHFGIMRIMRDLPIAKVLDSLRGALEASPAVVLMAPPGAGKTTQVPLAIRDASWLAGRRILMLEPRRLAARAAAARMAELVGESVGQSVGYRVRFDTQVSASTQIEVVTEGVLTRRLQQDAALDGVGLVIFDEFHERHLDTDLALALTLDAQRGLREDLRILVMSATLDALPVAALLGDAPIVECTGRSYPVDLRYLPRDPEGRIGDVVAAAVLRVLQETEGDVLAFLPGGSEIRRAQARLEGDPASSDFAVYPLYGDLPKDAQDRALRSDSSGRRKVVLATSIAETSLTIEGVRIVVDGGYVRTPRFDPASGLTRLETVRVSQAAATQRAGRAGRVAPGVCYRLWSEQTQRGLVPRSAPEILSADLAPLALDLANWGVRDPRSLSWLDPPPGPALTQAQSLLQGLDALDQEGRITAPGRAMADIPLHPRLAHMLRQAPSALVPLACDIAALLSERDVLRRNEGQRSADLTDRVESLIGARAGRVPAQADAAACSQVERAARQWRRVMRANAATETDAFDVGRLLALAYPDRVAQQREPNGLRYRLANGKGVRLAHDDAHLRQHRFLVVANLDAGRAEGLVYLAAPIREDALRETFATRITVHDVVEWDDAQQVVRMQREERLGALVLATKPLSDVDADRAGEAMLDGLRGLGLGALPWTPASRELQARVLSLRGWFPDEGWPDLSDLALAASFDWLVPYLHGVTRREHLARLDLAAILQACLSWEQRRHLDAAAPTHITVPSGSRIRLEYRPDTWPVLAVKLQELFGLADTPRVAGGRIPVTLHLLSPARRPIQVTQDLRGFWERTYPEVKKELKGRYPKHPWPDDPYSAIPTKRTLSSTRR